MSSAADTTASNDATTTSDEKNTEQVASNNDDTVDDDADLEKLQEEIRKMEEEAARIAKQTEQLQSSSSSGAASASKSSGVLGASAHESSASGGGETKRDGFSVYVGQVEYSATPEELLSHFEPCGSVERVTICCDKFTGRPKGFACEFIHSVCVIFVKNNNLFQPLPHNVLFHLITKQYFIRFRVPGVFHFIGE